MANDPTLEELAKSFRGTETGRFPKPKFMGWDPTLGYITSTPKEEPDTIELTAEEVKVTVVALCMARDHEAAKRLGITKESAFAALNSAYKKLKDD